MNKLPKLCVLKLFVLHPKINRNFYTNSFYKIGLFVFFEYGLNEPVYSCQFKIISKLLVLLMK